MSTHDPAGAMALQSVLKLDLAPEDLRIEFDPTPTPNPCAETLRVWERMREAKPRLFNGPISTFNGCDERARTIRAGRDTYQRLTVQPEVDNSVMQFSVTGVLICAEHVLLARRSPETRVYPSMWELAPSGGFDPPATELGTPLSGLDAWRQLLRELKEELGLAIPDQQQPGRIVALSADRLASSTDLVFRIDLPSNPADLDSAITSSWEYEETRWLPLPDARIFESDHGAEIIPPTRALLRSLF